MGVIVETKYGRVEGYEKRGICHFKGIPFARPPVGKLRFQAPQEAEPWSGIRAATEYGRSCPQDNAPLMGVGETGEDCLYLNVWTPEVGNRHRRPVLVWIHGGGFFIGSGSQGPYNGARLAHDGHAVVVTINYRLGALGFLHLADLPGSLPPSSSNCGLLDQVAALKWVKENIAAFGGDPGNVTIFGESAGGMSVGCLLGMPAAQGLFQRAIPQSGAAHHTTPREDATSVTQALLAGLGLGEKDADKLWEVSVKDLLRAQRKCGRVQIRRGPGGLPQFGMTLIPVLDGEVFPKEPYEAIAEGIAKDVDVMIGTTLEEWKLFTALSQLGSGSGGGNPWLAMDFSTEEAVKKTCEISIPGHGERAVETYKAARAERKAAVSPRELYSAIETDRTFRIPAVRLAEAQSRHQPNTYLYLFDWKAPGMGGVLGACHAVEIPFVFGRTKDQFGMMFTGGTAEAAAFSHAVQDTWMAFARSGNPANAHLGEWPAYGAARRATMTLAKEPFVQDDPMSAERRFWEGIF